MLSVAKKIDAAFGRRLRTLREERGWTQAQLGEKAGMAYQDVARLEQSEREPVWGTVLKLSKALGVRPDAFVDESAGEASDQGEPGKPAPKRRGKK